MSIPDDQIRLVGDRLVLPGVTHTHVRPTGGRRDRGVAASMAAAAADHGAAAVVVGSRGRSAAREIILGSVAMSMLHNSHRPVMVPGPSRKS